MPKEAIKLGAADEVVSIGAMAAAILQGAAGSAQRPAGWPPEERHDQSARSCSRSAAERPAGQQRAINVTGNNIANVTPPGFRANG